jgi:uncharacterized membrane protein YGL010W
MSKDHTPSIVHELGIYDAIHRHPVNRILHAVGIPVIMFSMLGTAALFRWPGGGLTTQIINGGTFIAVLCGLVIGRRGFQCGVALAAFALVLTWGALALEATVGCMAAAAIYAGAFVIGWVIQFVGHGIERAGPAFGSRPINLLLGPVSVLNEVLPLVRPLPWRR